LLSVRTSPPADLSRRSARDVAGLTHI